MSRQHLCPGGSGEYGPPVPCLSDLGEGPGAPGGPDEVGRADRKSRYVGLQPSSGNRRPVEYTKRSFGQRGKGAKRRESRRQAGRFPGDFD